MKRLTLAKKIEAMKHLTLHRFCCPTLHTINLAMLNAPSNGKFKI
jgi:hypothetical protein